MRRREVDLRRRGVHGVQCACECAALASSGWRWQAAGGLSGWRWHGAWLWRRRNGILRRLGRACWCRLCEWCCARDWCCCWLRSWVGWWWATGGGGGHACIGARGFGGIGLRCLLSDALSFAWCYGFVDVDRDRRHLWAFAGRWLGVGSVKVFCTLSCSC